MTLSDVNFHFHLKLQWQDVDSLEQSLAERRLIKLRHVTDVARRCKRLRTAITGGAYGSLTGRVITCQIITPDSLNKTQKQKHVTLTGDQNHN
jgi:hypothetical protein